MARRGDAEAREHGDTEGSRMWREAVAEDFAELIMQVRVDLLREPPG